MGEGREVWGRSEPVRVERAEWHAKAGAPKTIAGHQFGIMSNESPSIQAVNPLSLQNEADTHDAHLVVRAFAIGNRLWRLIRI